MRTRTPTVAVGIVDKQPSVLRFAAREARFANAELKIIHAAWINPQTAEFWPNADVPDSVKVAGQHVLDDAQTFLERELGNPPAEFIMTDETPILSLERAAASAYMLVLGTDDVPWYERLLRTRTAGFLALRAPCPVVIVPEVDYPRSMEGEVVVTLDGDTPAAGPLRFAFEQASARDSILHVLHAVPPATTVWDAADLRANTSEVLAGWREYFPDVAVLEGVAVGEPRDVIERATKGAELVVVGRPPSRTLPLAVTRPLAWSLVKSANCPVAVVPANYPGL
ncbi:MAG: universal stress protein [Aeromicrobium sp.]